MIPDKYDLEILFVNLISLEDLPVDLSAANLSLAIILLPYLIFVSKYY